MLLTPNLMMPKKCLHWPFENKPSVVSTVEPQYNEPLYNEVLGITNDFLYPSSKASEKEPRYKETSL